MVSFEIKEDNLRQFGDYPPLGDLHLPVIVSLDLVLHMLIIECLAQGIAQRTQRVSFVVLEQQVQLVELLRKSAGVGFLWVA